MTPLERGISGGLVSQTTVQKHIIKGYEKNTTLYIYLSVTSSYFTEKIFSGFPSKVVPTAQLRLPLIYRVS